jgi:hypothetical protein
MTRPNMSWSRHAGDTALASFWTPSAARQHVRQHPSRAAQRRRFRLRGSTTSHVSTFTPPPSASQRAENFLGVVNVAQSSLSRRRSFLTYLRQFEKGLTYAKSLLALHFPSGRYHWSSRKVGGIATPVARTACEASAVSLAVK